MKARGRAGRRVLAATLLAGALLLPLPVLEVRPDLEAAPRLARLALPGHRFSLEYRHSVFDVPVHERFRVDLAGRLVLEQVRSTRQDVIGYYHIVGAATRLAPGEVVILPPPAPRDRLRVRASGIGGRSFADGRCRVPLAALTGEGGAAVLEVRYRPALAALVAGSPACPTSRALATTR